jgi:hypothetical protein
MTDLRKTDLYEKLNGLGTNEVYVHRDDLKKLFDHISRELDMYSVIEVPEQVDDAYYRAMLTDWSKEVNIQMAAFDSIKGSTWNAKDLDPTVIERSLNKEFTWDEGERRWKHNAGGSTGGGFSFLGILSAQGELQGSYSDEGLERSLKKHGIEASFIGRRIVPKSLDLQRINMGDFAKESRVTSATIFVTGGFDRSESGTIVLRVEPGEGYPDLAMRLAEVETKTEQLGRLIENLKIGTRLNSAEGQLREMGFRYETFLITVATQAPVPNGFFVAGDGRKPPDQGGHVEYLIPNASRSFGREVLAAWYEPNETLSSVPLFYRIDVSPTNKNQVKVALSGIVQPKPQGLVIKVYVIYRE